jgi:hypothetical protein
VAGHHLPLVRELPDQCHDPVMGHQKLLRPASQDDVVEGNSGAAFRDDIVEGVAVQVREAKGARVRVKWSSRCRSPDASHTGI